MLQHRPQASGERIYGAARNRRKRHKLRGRRCRRPVRTCNGVTDHRPRIEFQRSVLKVKLATAIISISSIHLLKTFTNVANYGIKALLAQTGTH